MLIASKQNFKKCSLLFEIYTEKNNVDWLLNKIREMLTSFQTEVVNLLSSVLGQIRIIYADWLLKLN